MSKHDPHETLLPDRDRDKSPAIECIGLGIDFGGLTAVDDFNFTLGRTEIAGLIGPTAPARRRFSTS